MNLMDSVNDGVNAWNKAVSEIGASREYLAGAQEYVRQANYDNQLAAWKEYAKKLESHVQRIEQNNTALNDSRNRAIKALEEEKNAHAKKAKKDTDYFKALVDRIKLIDEQVVRHSGKAHLNARMRDFLMTKMIEIIGREKSKVIYDEMVSQKLIDMYWEEFENSGDPRHGYPFSLDMTKSLLPSGKLITSPPVNAGNPLANRKPQG